MSYATIITSWMNSETPLESRMRRSGAFSAEENPCFSNYSNFLASEPTLGALNWEIIAIRNEVFKSMGQLERFEYDDSNRRILFEV